MYAVFAETNTFVQADEVMAVLRPEPRKSKSKFWSAKPLPKKKMREDERRRDELIRLKKVANDAQKRELGLEATRKAKNETAVHDAAMEAVDNPNLTSGPSNDERLAAFEQFVRERDGHMGHDNNVPGE